MSKIRRCSECPKRARCTKLCEEMEKYVNQDTSKRVFGDRQDTKTGEHERLGGQSIPVTLIDRVEERSMGDVWNALDLYGWGIRSNPHPIAGKAHRIALGEEEWAIIQNIPSLTDRDKEILRMYYWDQKTHAEIAGCLNVNRTTITKRLKLILQELKNWFLRER